MLSGQNPEPHPWIGILVVKEPFQESVIGQLHTHRYHDTDRQIPQILHTGEKEWPQTIFEVVSTDGDTKRDHVVLVRRQRLDDRLGKAKEGRPNATRMLRGKGEGKLTAFIGLEPSPCPNV